MCDICGNNVSVWRHPTHGNICRECIHWSYCYGCFIHEKVCGIRYKYQETLQCLTCMNILYETDNEYTEFLQEINILK